MLIASAAMFAGFLILIWSADRFVAGAAAIACNLGLPPVIIGLTIVSIGTSAPEILVSIAAALTGAGELAVGNAIGSNIANIGLVLGCTALVAPLIVLRRTIQNELALLLVVTVAAGLLLGDGTLSVIDGGLMLAALAFSLGYMLRSQATDLELGAATAEDGPAQIGLAKAWLIFVLGLVLLIASSRLLVWGAVTAASILGVSELVIGLTVVAVGTSLPELAASTTSALRGHSEIALGNVVGSNLFNLLAVMPIPGLLGPEILDGAVMTRDYPVMLALTLALALALYLGGKRRAAPAGHAYLGRLTGVLLVIIYALYYCWLYLTL
ncbi:MAG: calcium/sodium antiporter [Pseudomonadales bacterium]|nr:calcium/sodium antiporter [Pseudomonadales bacterium]